MADLWCGMGMGIIYGSSAYNHLFQKNRGILDGQINLHRMVMGCDMGDELAC